MQIVIIFFKYSVNELGTSLNFYCHWQLTTGQWTETAFIPLEVNLTVHFINSSIKDIAHKIHIKIANI